MTPIYPKPIYPGDTIGIVLPSSMITQFQLDQVVAAARQLGLNCKIGATAQRAVTMFTAQQDGTIGQLLPTWPVDWQDEYHHFIASGYMAGNPKGRADDINNFFADPEISAIFCQRGGFSSSKVVPYLDYDIIAANPKIILGHSDITNIIAAIYQNTDIATYHAPMFTPNWIKPELLDQDDGVDSYTFHYFQKFIMSDWQTVAITNPADQPTWTIQPGQAAGQIVGGNLSELAQAIGTNYQLDTTDKIVFIEEVKTHIPLCDSYLNQLKNCGFFKNIRGLIIGDFLNCLNRTGFDKCQTWRDTQLLLNHFADATYPVLAHVKIGHDSQTSTIPLGAWCELDADRGVFTISRQ